MSSRLNNNPVYSHDSFGYDLLKGIKMVTEDIFERLNRSDFRRRFRLRTAEILYVRQKGTAVTRKHAEDFISKRLVPAQIANDGKQTPMCGHPVFIAQHATATCCRQCLYKWHRISPGIELTVEQQRYVVDLIMEWICRQSR